MPIFLLPVAVGGLALTALGLGVKRILEELPQQPVFPPGTRGHEAWARWMPMVLETGDMVGRLMNAEPGSIVMHQNVSTLQSVVASSAG